LLNAHVIPALIHKCYLAKQNNKSFEIMGTGKPLRQFIYSKDLAQLIMWVLENYIDSESIILSVNDIDEISINDIVNLIRKEFNYFNIIFNNSNLINDGQYKKTASNKKLMSLIENFNFTPISEGLTFTINWFIENYETCRK
jgi:GDP-L-fucose synthase